MIKFETMTPDAAATVTVDGAAGPVFVGMVVTEEVLATLQVTAGTVGYTVDEGYPVEVSAKAAPSTKA